MTWKKTKHRRFWAAHRLVRELRNAQVLIRPPAGAWSVALSGLTLECSPGSWLPDPLPVQVPEGWEWSIRGSAVMRIEKVTP